MKEILAENSKEVRDSKGRFFKGCKMTEQTKNKISQITRNRWKNESYKKLIINKISQANTGKKRTAEQNKRNSESHKGQISWAKGKHLSSETIRKMVETARKNNSYSWSPETLKKRSESHKGKHSYWRGKHLTTEHKQKLSDSLKGRIGPTSGRHLTTKHKQKLSASSKGRIVKEETKIKIRINRAKQIFPLIDTKIEIKIQDYLRRLYIEFFTHQYMKEIKYAYQCDILIPVQPGILKKTIIECDGDYWHGNTKIFDFRKLPLYIKNSIPLDFERTAQLEEQGFRVIRLWEHEIKIMSITEFKNKLMER